MKDLPVQGLDCYLTDVALIETEKLWGGRGVDLLCSETELIFLYKQASSKLK